jgi:hypothetical protein
MIIHLLEGETALLNNWSLDLVTNWKCKRISIRPHSEIKSIVYCVSEEERHLTSNHTGEVERRESYLTDEIIAETVKTRMRILSDVVTPYEELLKSDNPRVQYYLDLIKIRIALSAGSIPLSDAYAAVKLLEEDPEFVVGNTFGPLPEIWTSEIIDKIIDNIKILQKARVIEASNAYAAFINSLKSASPQVAPRGFLEKIFSYFVYNPLATYTQAGQDLQCHRSTAKSGFENVNKLHRIMALSLLNGCHFGIKGFTLFFEMNDQKEWETIREPLLSFPFTKTLHRGVTSPFGFVSFAIPGSDRNQAELRRSLEKITRRYFDYSSLHLSQGLDRIVNPGLLNDGNWELPECLISGEIRGPVKHKSAISSIGCPSYLSELTKDDFITSEIVSYHLRKPNSELAEIMTSRGYEVKANQIAYRIRKMMQLGVMSPWLWFSGAGLHYSFTIELVSNKEARQKIFEAVSGFPEVFTTPTDRGAIIWLEIPKFHLKNYYDYLSLLSKLPGVERIRPILATERSAGKNYIDIYENLEFGDDGFCNASNDMDINSYIP